MTEEQIKDYTLRITQSNASALAVITCELAEDCMKEAKTAVAQEDWKEYCHLVKKAERYIGELIHSMNDNDPAGKIMMGYCVEVHRNLIQARIGKMQSLLEEAEAMLKPVQEVLTRVAREDSEPPVMENTQKIYVGLTYGRTSLNEMAVDPRSNRGYTV